jgi:hypothetical protein
MNPAAPVTRTVSPKIGPFSFCPVSALYALG